jgi:hypothetical protein
MIGMHVSHSFLTGCSPNRDAVWNMHEQYLGRPGCSLDPVQAPAARRSRFLLSIGQSDLSFRSLPCGISHWFVLGISSIGTLLHMMIQNGERDPPCIAVWVAIPLSARILHIPPHPSAYFDSYYSACVGYPVRAKTDFRRDAKMNNTAFHCMAPPRRDSAKPPPVGHSPHLKPCRIADSPES